MIPGSTVRKWGEAEKAGKPMKNSVMNGSLLWATGARACWEPPTLESVWSTAQNFPQMDQEARKFLHQQCPSLLKGCSWSFTFPTLMSVPTCGWRYSNVQRMSWSREIKETFQSEKGTDWRLPQGRLQEYLQDSKIVCHTCSGVSESKAQCCPGVIIPLA